MSSLSDQDLITNHLATIIVIMVITKIMATIITHKLATKIITTITTTTIIKTKKALIVAMISSMMTSQKLRMMVGFHSRNNLKGIPWLKIEDLDQEKRLIHL